MKPLEADLLLQGVPVDVCGQALPEPDCCCGTGALAAGSATTGGGHGLGGAARAEEFREATGPAAWRAGPEPTFRDSGGRFPGGTLLP